MNLHNIISDLHGWCSIEKATRLHQLVLESNAHLSVELGVFGGKSLIPMALAHKEKGSGFILGIDPWTKQAATEGTNDPENNKWWESLDLKSIYDSCQKAISDNELEGYCETLRMKSQAVSVLFPHCSIDILHQDSNHNTETITEELNLWIPKLKVGGYWIADDTDWKEAKEGYSQLPKFGLKLIEDFTTWQIWKK